MTTLTCLILSRWSSPIKLSGVKSSSEVTHTGTRNLLSTAQAGATILPSSTHEVYQNVLKGHEFSKLALGTEGNFSQGQRVLPGCAGFTLADR